MGNKAIIRVAKHSTIGGLAASGQHNFRERETQNADAERTPLNEVQGAEETADLLNRVSNLLPALQKKTLKDGTEVVSKRRKDAVICLEYLITASPAHFGEWRESGNHGQDYFDDSIAWLEKKHGKQNVVCTTVHLDESTPHLCAYVVPITKDGRLSAKDFVGGRKVLADLQTDFAERVGKKHNLERGELMSNAVHREPAHIASMTKERRRLEKQVKALEAEIERLTKSVSGGADALKKAQTDLIAAQAQVAQVIDQLSADLTKAQGLAQSRKEHMGKLQSQSVTDMKEIQNLKTENEEMKKTLITATERDHQLVAEIAALRKENERAQPTQEQLKAIDRVLVDQTRERMAQEALRRDSEAQVAWVSARGDLPSPDALASRLRLTPEAGLQALVGTGRIVESHGLHAVMTYRGEKFLHKFESRQELELAIGRGKGMAMGGRA